MNITYNAKGFKITQNIIDYIKEGIESHISKYTKEESLLKASMSKESKLFNTEINLDLKEKFMSTIHSSFSSDNAYTSIDGAIIKLLSKLRKYKYKFKNKEIKKGREVKAYLINGADINPNDTEFPNEESLIAETKSIEIKRMTITSALMELDLMSSTIIIFINDKTNRINILHKKSDNTTILVDTNQM